MPPLATRILWTILGVVVSLGLIWAGIGAWSAWMKVPSPLADRCVATVKTAAVAVDLEQARNAGIIAAVAIVRNLPPRATSIALATAYQESGIRNLNYGHADSLGIFQQRPSQGWGTKKQVMDPYYASNKFYAALENVKGWESGDINDMAQKVQRSAYPDGYRRHVPNARTLASSLSGQSPATFSCVVSKPATGDPKGLAAFITKAYRDHADVSTVNGEVKVSTGSLTESWGVAHLAVSGVASYGVAEVTIADRTWTHDPSGPATWQRGQGDPEDDQVVIRFTKA